MAKLCRDIVLLLREEGRGSTPSGVARRTAAAAGLEERYGYTADSAADAAAVLLKDRYLGPSRPEASFGTRLAAC